MLDPAHPQGLLFPERAAPAPSPPAAAPLEQHLERLFGFTAFRPGQREAIEAVLAGRDALAVMPTGGGKSMTYLLPAFLLPGVTIVVSPLLSLIQDQVQKLAARGLPATCLSSQVGWEEQQRRLDALRAGRLKLLFVAPERFRNARFARALEGARVSLVAVDEAHCVSQWGHDFRPDYRRLAEAIRACGRPPVLAVTATATRQVRDDIARQLELGPELVTLVRGFERPNLHLSVMPVAGGRGERLRMIERLVAAAKAGGQAKGPGIIYCATRKNADRLAHDLGRAGHQRLGVYHAGMPGPARARVQDRFFAGQLDLVVATNAFGLGIDKQDVRFVVHHDLPGSLEAYYQEAGRAGRDGLPARCALVFGYQDVHLQRFFIETAHPSRQLVAQVAGALGQVGPDPEALRARLPERPSERAVESALRLLDQAGGRLEAVDFAAVKARAAHDEALLRRLLAYARDPGCRHRAILRYFGAPAAEGPCGACDRCAPDPTIAAAPAPRPRAAAPAPRRRAEAAPRGAPPRRERTGRRPGAPHRAAHAADDPRQQGQDPALPDLPRQDDRRARGPAADDPRRPARRLRPGRAQGRGVRRGDPRRDPGTDPRGAGPRVARGGYSSPNGSSSGGGASWSSPGAGGMGPSSRGGGACGSAGGGACGSTGVGACGSAGVTPPPGGATGGPCISSGGSTGGKALPGGGPWSCPSSSWWWSSWSSWPSPVSSRASLAGRSVS
ncbi:MAG: ATP-dependent DNA helicase [Planctomycetes bacterium]|nr:ATP-dependent DNA helicase [Planctomycetota bacterium]